MWQPSDSEYETHDTAANWKNVTRKRTAISVPTNEVPSCSIVSVRQMIQSLSHLSDPALCGFGYIYIYVHIYIYIYIYTYKLSFPGHAKIFKHQRNQLVEHSHASNIRTSKYVLIGHAGCSELWNMFNEWMLEGVKCWICEGVGVASLWHEWFVERFECVSMWMVAKRCTFTVCDKYSSATLLTHCKHLCIQSFDKSNISHINIFRSSLSPSVAALIVITSPCGHAHRWQTEVSCEVGRVVRAAPCRRSLSTLIADPLSTLLGDFHY